MTRYLPDHLVRCLICQNLFTDARRLRCGCVFCYLCCLKLVKNYILSCPCSAIQQFHSQEELEKALVIDTVVNDLVRQHIKQKENSSMKLVDYEINSISSRLTEDDQRSVSIASSNTRKQIAVVQPPCSICQKKFNLLIFCDHCQSDICELCTEKHYERITNQLQERWIHCRAKFEQINQNVESSHQNKIDARQKLEEIRRTIEERTRDLKDMIINQRQRLTKQIDHHVKNLDEIIKANKIDHTYQSIRERLPKILEEETHTANILTFLQETEELLQQIIMRNKQLKEIEVKIPYLSPSTDLLSLNVSQLIGELKLDDLSSTRTNENNSSQFISTVPEHTRFSRRMRPSIRSRGTRGIQYPSYFIGMSPRNNPNYRRGRYNGNRSFRGRLPSASRPPPIQSREHDFDTVPNNQYQWSIDFKEIPYFLSVLDNRNRARQPDTRPHHRHDYMLFIADDYGRISVYSLPKSRSHIKPTVVGTGELFSKNSRLLMESFTVYEFAIVVYMRRFEQRSNEIEHSKLMKAGLPIMKGEQGRCNDHGGMIYLFSHGGDEIDGVYQPHPIRVILADQNLGRLWALNPMQNNIYSYRTPFHQDEIHKCFEEEEIVLDFFEDEFEPSIMFQSDQSIGLIDTEHDLYRLYTKDNQLQLIATYDSSQNQSWKLTSGVIFKDNRTLLKLTEDRLNKNHFHHNAQRCLIELTPNGEEKRRIQADTLYSMVLGPDDEIILGFANRGDRGLIHCY